MFNYLVKFAIRGFQRNRTFFVINIFGLSLSLTAFVVISNYLAYEYSYDQHHGSCEQLVRVVRHYGGESPASFANCFAAVGPHAAASIPSVTEFGRVVFSDKILSRFSLSYEDEKGTITAFNHKGAFFADQGIADFFIDGWIEGNPEQALNEPNQIIISESVARMYFDSGPALGKSLRLNDLSSYEISGVFEDQPENTHLPLQVLCSMTSLPPKWDLNNEWGWGNFHTYLRVNSKEGLSKSIRDMASEHLTPDDGLPDEFGIQPVAAIHLQSDLRHEIKANGSGSTMTFLTIVAWMIMVIGWINYVNLYTAKAAEAAQSIVLKKVIGSNRPRILAQLLIESLIMGLLASAIALTASQLLLPVLQNHLGLMSLVHLSSQVGYLLVFLLGLLLVSAYPMVKIARVPAKHLVHKESVTVRGVSLRKVLVLCQFSLTTLLVISTIVVADQKDFMMHYDTGFEKEQILVVETPASVKEHFEATFDLFKDAVASDAAVREVGLAAHLPGYEVTRMRWIHVKGHALESNAHPKVIAADPGYFRTLGFELLAGRFFEEDFNDRFSIVINEATAFDLGFPVAIDALGQPVIIEDEEYRVVGVMANYHQRSLRSNFQPIIFVENASLLQHFTVALQSREMHDLISTIEGIFHRFYPNDPFDYFFLDSYYDQQYAQDITFGRVTSIFSILAIVIALFGLVGLTIFSVNQRVKEIGIRKVLGARWSELIWLFNASFMRLIVGSFVLSIPVSYLLMNRWLEDYAHRIQLQLVHFVLPLVLVSAIAGTIVAIIVSKFVRINPAEILRTE